MSKSVAGKAALDALRNVTSSFDGAEERQGQMDMSHAIAESLAAGRSIIVQAGTGTGKSLGYLIPAILSGKTAVVATATKALQDQLARNDLPLLQRTMGVDFTYTVIKGRSNYVCRQRLAEIEDKEEQIEFEEMRDSVKKEIESIITWSRRTDDGDLEEMDVNPSDQAKRAVSVGSEDCPGRNKCPFGSSCFYEVARESARTSDVIVTNIHLYGAHIASGGNILPEHELVIFDEAHQLESTLSQTTGIELSGNRFSALGSAIRQVIADANLTNRLEESGLRFSGAIGPFVDQRLPLPLPSSISEPLSTARIEINSLIAELKKMDEQLGEKLTENQKQKSLRAQTQAARLAESIDSALGGREGFVAFVEGLPTRPKLRISPLHVGELLNKNVWDSHLAVLTSATVPVSMPDRVGLPLDGTEVLTVESPFDYARNSRLYCNPNFPEVGHPDRENVVNEELEALITAAGGRTLALFTSNKALNAATEAMRERLPFPILSATEHSRQKLIDMFMEDETACIFASSGFFQGVDLPGRTLSLVVLDKIPFPLPTDPLLEARREAVGRKDSFNLIDIPIAATALAQAAGRLIRTATDQGVVAVLDSRLATKSYRRFLLDVLPPMKRTINRSEVEQFLRDITQ